MVKLMVNGAGQIDGQWGWERAFLHLPELDVLVPGLVRVWCLVCSV